MVKNVENVRKGVYKMILYFEEKNLLDIMYTYIINLREFFNWRNLPRSTTMCPCPWTWADGQGQGHIDVDVDMGRIDIRYYSSTFCPIQHFVHSTFCPIRHFGIQHFVSFDVISVRQFVPFDVLSHSAFLTFEHYVSSAFCPIPYFVCSTFCLIRNFGIRLFVPFDVLSFDVLSIRRLLLRHFVGEPCTSHTVQYNIIILNLNLLRASLDVS
jgi:hypothetical protein